MHIVVQTANTSTKSLLECHELFLSKYVCNTGADSDILKSLLSIHIISFKVDDTGNDSGRHTSLAYIAHTQHSLQTVRIRHTHTQHSLHTALIAHSTHCTQYS